MESTVRIGTKCELCKRKVISGRMVAAPHGGYVCEECCLLLTISEIVTVGEEGR